MFQVHQIDSLDSPELAPYRTMRQQASHREQGVFIAESDKVVHRLLQSNLSILSLVIPEKWLVRFEPLLSARSERIDVYLLEKKELESLTGFTFYQGVLALARIPAPPPLGALLHNTSPASPPLMMAVEGITSAENLGSLVRNGVAFGTNALLVDQSACSPFLRRAVRASMGTLFSIPALEKLHLVETIRTLRQNGFCCIAAHPGASQNLYEFKPSSGPCCVVFGSEGFGISPALLEVCDESLSIPMAPGVDSLNVGSAAAVFLYEMSRTRSSASKKSVFK
jgi:tRNA G18 (ribose-2'-O)-methylase SpoU